MVLTAVLVTPTFIDSSFFAIRFCRPLRLQYNYLKETEANILKEDKDIKNEIEELEE